MRDLDINTHYHFGLGKILAFPLTSLKKLKKIKFMIANFLSTHYKEGQSKLSSYYPKKGAAKNGLSY